MSKLGLVALGGLTWHNWEMALYQSLCSLLTSAQGNQLGAVVNRLAEHAQREEREARQAMPQLLQPTPGKREVRDESVG